MSNPFERVVFRGKLMDEKTKAFLLEMEARLGYELTVVQGCYNPGGVAQSGGTHDGGGVVDLAAYDYQRKVRVAANLGAFVWYRHYIPGLWGAHIHLGIRDHGRLSPEAHRQQQDWDARPPRDGLASHAVWTGYHPRERITFKMAQKQPKPPVSNNITKARDELVQAIHSLGDAAAFIDDVDPARVKAKAQLDDIKDMRRQLKIILKAMPEK